MSYSVDHDCESDTVVQKETVYIYSNIKFDACMSTFVLLIILTAVLYVVLTIEIVLGRTMKTYKVNNVTIRYKSAM